MAQGSKLFRAKLNSSRRNLEPAILGKTADGKIVIVSPEGEPVDIKDYVSSSSSSSSVSSSSSSSSSVSSSSSSSVTP